MKKFLAVYLGSGEKMKNWKPDEATMKQGMEAWNKWMQDHAAAVVETGAPLGKTKKIDKNGVSDTKNALSGYVVVQAESHEEAAKLFENHPHFTVFTGESIEIM